MLRSNLSASEIIMYNCYVEFELIDERVTVYVWREAFQPQNISAGSEYNQQTSRAQHLCKRSYDYELEKG